MKVDDLQNFIVVLILVGILLGVSTTILFILGENAKNELTVTFANDSLATMDAVNGEQLTGTAALEDCTATISVMTNATGTTIAASNYTVTGCLVKAVVGSTFIGEDWNASGSYIYNASTKASTTTDNTVDALTPISSEWLPIIVIVAIMSIILGMVLGFRGLRR